MRLILIRHGQTPNNVLRLLDTSIPGPGLTPLGFAQAQAVPHALENEDIEALYISTLTRTALTAAPLAEAKDLVPDVRDGLREIAAGDVEMKGDDASVGIYLEAVKAWLKGDLSVRMPGADSGHEILARFDAVVAEALATGATTVAMVSHGAMIRFWAGIRGNNIDWADPKYHDLSNTGMVILESTDAAKNSGTTSGGWDIIDWRGAPAGGLAGLDGDGPTAELELDGDHADG